MQKWVFFPAFLDHHFEKDPLIAKLDFKREASQIDNSNLEFLKSLDEHQMLECSNQNLKFCMSSRFVQPQKLIITLLFEFCDDFPPQRISGSQINKVIF